MNLYYNGGINAALLERLTWRGETNLRYSKNASPNINKFIEYRPLNFITRRGIGKMTKFKSNYT